VERCAKRFAELHGEDDEVRAHPAEMLARVARRWPSPRLWTKSGDGTARPRSVCCRG
jgi:hypothetical protein